MLRVARAKTESGFMEVFWRPLSHLSTSNVFTGLPPIVTKIPRLSTPFTNIHGHISGGSCRNTRPLSRTATSDQNARRTRNFFFILFCLFICSANVEREWLA